MAEDQEVDVQLFITCRLCLDEPGLYQIVPLIKGQIKYCFGIDIDPFDGLPQLICKKCKCILNEYHAIKNTFEEKQNQLRKRALKHNKVPQSVDFEAIEGEKSTVADGVPHGNCETSPAATDVAPQGNFDKSPAPADVASQSNRNKKRASWKKAYDEYFVCTICCKSYLTEKSIKKHMTAHKTIMRKHEKVFKNCLTIQMNKIDKKKNVTGRIQHVVYDKNKIIKKRVTSNYYSFYLKKGFEENNKTDEKENVPIIEHVNKGSEGKRRLSESSDDVIIKAKKRKSRRLFSNSSTQTVVLDVSKEEECIDTVDTTQAEDPKTPNETETAEAECINIDDTSSDCPKPELRKKVRVMPQRQQVKAKVGDYKAIQSIVTMCHKNYIKKVQSENDLNDKPTFSESSLKHKVLSLGRKVINKQGFSCTGILRYMEHKDLAITWKPTSIAMQSKGSNYVRIMTKLKSREDSENEDAGWKNINHISLCRDSDKENNICEKLPKENETIESEACQPDQTDEDPPPASPCEISDLNSTNKLSLTTPVPTSKQTIIVKPIIIPNEAAVLPQTVESEDPQVEDSNMLMPIITSTTSLSGKRIVSVAGIPMPRIKVKPASELMSERALSNQEASEDIWPFNVRHSSTPQLFTDTAVDPEPSTSGLQNGSILDVSEIAAPVSNQTVTQSATVETNRNRNQNLASVILNSPELPNTRTESPFRYFRTLLLFHELQLLELNEVLADDLTFHCLVRFKLLLKQHTRKTITVLLSLFCSNNKFCFTFKDANFKMFDPNRLPGFWQWELLKVYKGSVVDKILLNASKLGKEVHEFTKHFLCLLKSIDLVPEP